MKPEDIKPGLKVITAPGLNPTTGMLIDDKFLKQRKSNQKAIVYGYVPGHGGDVWWLLHDGATTYTKVMEDGSHVQMYDKEFIAPYMFTEFMPVKE